MRFFDNKEDVLDIQMTSYGKFLLSKGKFKPAYYSFSDEGIIYDSNCGGFSELQNDAQDRIKNKTPYLKVQTSYGSVEGRKVSIPRDQLRLSTDLPDFDQTDYRLTYNALGSMDPAKEKKPAWLVRCLQGNIIHAQTTITGSTTIPNAIDGVPISQVDFKTVDYEIVPVPYDALTGPMEFLPDEENCELQTVTITMDTGDGDVFLEDGSSFILEGRPIVLEIEEENVSFTNENFEIEIFEVDEAESDNQAINGSEILTRLSFTYEKPEVINGILVEESKEEEVSREIDEDFTEYFFDILTDGDIDKTLLCRLGANDSPEGLFSKRMLECDILQEDSKIGADDLYATDVDPEDLEDC